MACHNSLYVIGRKQRHLRILFCQMKVISGITTPSDSVLMRIFSWHFPVSYRENAEYRDDGHVNDCASTLTRAELVGIGKCVFHIFITGITPED